MNTNGQEGVKARKLKTIIVSIVALIVILIVGIWAITSAINSGKKAAANNNKQTETSKTEDKKTEETKVSDPATATSPSEQYSVNPQTESTPVAENTPVESNNMPTTGPAEVVFSALMLGVVASLAVLNVQLVKENR